MARGTCWHGGTSVRYKLRFSELSLQVACTDWMGWAVFLSFLWNSLPRLLVFLTSQTFLGEPPRLLLSYTISLDLRWFSGGTGPPEPACITDSEFYSRWPKPMLSMEKGVNPERCVVFKGV